MSHQTQQKISRPYFVVRIFLRLTFFYGRTVKILSFLRLTAKLLAVLRLTVNPIETLMLRPRIRLLPHENEAKYFRPNLRLGQKRPKTLMETIAFDAFFGTVFKGFHFHLSTLETSPFQNHGFLKRLTFAFKSSRFKQHFRVF